MLCSYHGQRSKNNFEIVTAHALDLMSMTAKVMFPLGHDSRLILKIIVLIGDQFVR